GLGQGLLLYLGLALQLLERILIVLVVDVVRGHARLGRRQLDRRDLGRVGAGAGPGAGGPRRRLIRGGGPLPSGWGARAPDSPEAGQDGGQSECLFHWSIPPGGALLRPVGRGRAVVAAAFQRRQVFLFGRADQPGGSLLEDLFRLLFQRLGPL